MSSTPPTSDNRLLFIRNMEALSSQKTETVEYEVVTDAETVGALEYGPYNLAIWEFSNKRPGEPRKLLLRITHGQLLGDDQVEEAKRQIFYHGGWVADEIVAISSLFLRRRLVLGPIVRQNDVPRILDLHTGGGLGGWVDHSLVAGQRNLTELNGAFSLVSRLDPKYHLPFILAARLYSRAIAEIENEPDLAYLDLVSAIEAMCQGEEIGNPSASWLDAGLEKTLLKVPDVALRAELEQAILRRERFISRRFVAFIRNNIEPGFWLAEERPQHGRVPEEQLPELLKRIYQQRSTTLHSGEPFPAYIRFQPTMDAELGLGLGVTVGGKYWSADEFIPNPCFFERLVNHVLRTFARRNPTQPLSSAHA